MSVVLEFTIDADQFQLGGSLSGFQDTTFELERIVPTGNHVIPFIWLTTDADLDTVLDAFETKLIDRPSITDVRALDRIENGALYRVTWRVPEKDIIDGLVQTDATVLEARSHSGACWEFRVRYPDHDHLARFQNILTENDVTIHIDRIYTFTKETDRRRQFGLSSEQREALVLALRRGYLASPSEVSLDELADELDITKQAVSDRIRRGNEKLLETTLLSSAVDG
ncbi:helix-turn-helix domain-containing protein [Natrarchaeobius oligotrophus]|uniref:Bacterio-opsin activator n=1 Tax=Natrarchaeobius chitinivorans TaxID=1679083 RepID=A0A3N6MKJ0_NATCH|nr:helix-turn-helix domain-containing protein [Natrarchaeobius chitinivorans]RQG94796.1 bacterio-opsin activator [Natrarchaeobius chitinivorans]